MQELFSALSLWLSAHPLITGWYTAIARLLFPVLSALILVRAIRSLLRIPHTPEVWAQLSRRRQYPPDPLGKYSGAG